MIYVPIWLFCLMLTAKSVTFLRGMLQAWQTKQAGRPVITMSFLLLGVFTAVVGAIYYSYLRDIFGVGSYAWSLVLTINMIYYKKKEIK